MKRTYLLSIVLCLSLFLCGCALGDSGSQFTQMDSQYLETEEASEREKSEESQMNSDGEKAEQKESEADNATGAEREVLQENNTSESEQAEKKDKRDSTSVDKDASKKKASDRTEKKASSKSKAKVENSVSQKAEKKENTASSKDKSTKEKDSEKKQENNSSKEEKNPAEPSKSESVPAEDTAFCTVSIDCQTILSNMSELKKEKKDFVPEDGWILKSTKVTLEEGDTAYDVLYKVCQKYKIHMEAAYTPAYGTYYVEGIHQLYEFDCGDLSGWTFLVNGKSLNYGCSKYEVKAGDVIQWRFSCNAGRDVK